METPYRGTAQLDDMHAYESQQQAINSCEILPVRGSQTPNLVIRFQPTILQTRCLKRVFDLATMVGAVFITSSEIFGF